MYDEQIKKLLNMAVKFYHDLLYKNRPQYEAQWDFLAAWDMEQPDLRKYKVGYCPDTNSFVRHYKEILTTYTPIREALKELGIIKEDEQGLKDALEGYYFFPCFDEKGALFNVALFHQKKGWRLLCPEDKLALFGLWQESYCITDHKMVFLLPDIKTFFHFNRLLFPTGFNPSLACLKGLNNFIFERLEDLGVDQVILIGQTLPEEIDTYLDVLEIEIQATPLATLKKALPELNNKGYKRLIEVGLEVLQDMEKKRREECANYYLTKSGKKTSKR